MRKIYEIWRNNRSDAALPLSNLIDPTRLPRDCLPYIGLLEVMHDPLRFRSRLVGTGIVDALGVDHTGQYIDEIGGMADQIQRFEWCVRERQPYFASAPLTFSPRDYKHYGVLTLPFADDDGRVSRLMFVFCFDEAAP
jgi:hypothetical protein